MKIDKTLREAIEHANFTQPTTERAQFALRALDLTSLKGNEDKAAIQDLVDKAIRYNLASVCVMPDKIALAHAARGGNTHIRIATVVNFHDGIHRSATQEIATAETTAQDVLNNNKLGATQNDIVLDFDGFRNAFIQNDTKKLDEIGAKLAACKNNIENSTMKIIVGTAAFEDLGLLRAACEFSAQFKPDCLKTDTGFHPNGGATLEKAAIMMDVAKRHNIGVKISAGVKDAAQAAQFQALAEAIYGEKELYKNSERFRIGASSALAPLVAFANDKQQTSGATAPQTPEY